MALLLGIDIGTSGLKCLIMEPDGKLRGFASRDYNYSVPKIGWAEQDPDEWWDALISALGEAIQGIDASDIKCIGFSGQMHGFIMLDADGRPVRPAILHCDVRSPEECEEINAAFGEGSITDITMNPVFPGMGIASLYWVRKNEPELYERIRHILCPKDYIRYRLTGEFGTDKTDASATILYDIEKQCWSQEIIDKLGFDASIFPPERHTPFDIAGSVTAAAAAATGLKEGTPVVFGGADMTMQSFGSGVHSPGALSSAIGTGGQTVYIVDKLVRNPKCNTHTFSHVSPDTWYAMGASLYAGITLNWYRRTFYPDKSYAELSTMAEAAPPCSDGMVFFPPLMGERTPYLDSNTRGVFLGFSQKHGAPHFIRSIMEGVVFNMKTGLDLLRGFYGEPHTIVAVGGATKSPLWLQIEADIYAAPLIVKDIKETASMGAAMAAGIGAGIYADADDACANALPKNNRVIEPIAENVKKYAEFYDEVFSRLYPQNKPLFDAVQKY